MTVPAGAVVLLAILTVAWGGNWPAMKLALAELPPWTFRALCLAGGGVGLLAIARLRGLPLAVPARERRPLLLVTLFNITLWHLSSAYALTLMGAGRASIVGYTMPLWAVLLGWLLYREPIGRVRLVALVLGLAGLAVLIGPDAARLGRAPAGALFMLAAALSWALGTVLLKRFVWTMPTTVLTGWQVLLGGVPVVPGALLLETPPASLSAAAVAGTLYAIVVGMMVCHYLWFHLLRILPAQVAAIGVVGVPVFGVLLSALVLGERVGWREVAAMALVLPAIATVLVGRDLPKLLRLARRPA